MVLVEAPATAPRTQRKCRPPCGARHHLVASATTQPLRAPLLERPAHNNMRTDLPRRRLVIGGLLTLGVVIIWACEVKVLQWVHSNNACLDRLRRQPRLRRSQSCHPHRLLRRLLVASISSGTSHFASASL